MAEYITSLLTRAREISNDVFLKASAATFKESWRMVDELVNLNADGAPSKEPFVTQTQAEDVVSVTAITCDDSLIHQSFK